jgi:hypothetical protein
MKMIEQSLSTMAAALTRIADALELISAGGSPDVKTTPKRTPKAKTTDAAPAPAAAQDVLDTVPGFSFTPIEDAPHAGEPVQVEKPADQVIPAFTMDNFMGVTPVTAPPLDSVIDCPIKSRDEFITYIRGVNQHYTDLNQNGQQVIRDVFSRFGCKMQSEISESLFPQVYAAFEGVKSGGVI